MNFRIGMHNIIHQIKKNTGIYCSLFLLASGQLFCQQNMSSRNLLARQVKLNALMFSFDFANNTNFLGNVNTEIKQPSYAPSVAFFSKWGADLAFSGYFTDNSDESLTGFSSEFDLAIGYTLEPFSGFTVYPAYSHFIHSQNANTLKSVFTNEFRLDADYQYKVVDIGISSGYLTGRQHNFYLSLRNYYQLDFNNVIFRHSILSILPGIDVNFGDYEYLNLYYLNKLKENPDFYAVLLFYSADLRRYVRMQETMHPDLTREEIIDNLLLEKARDDFKLTSVNLSLPVTYIIGNFSFNIGLYTFFPVSQPAYISNDPQFYFNIGLAYSLIF